MSEKYVSNLTSGLKSLDIDETNADTKYRSYSVDEDATYVAVARDDLDKNAAASTDAAANKANSTVVSDASDAADGPQNSTVPRPILNEAPIAIPVYNQTPIETPVETPVVSLPKEEPADFRGRKRAPESRLTSPSEASVAEVGEAEKNDDFYTPKSSIESGRSDDDNSKEVSPIKEASSIKEVSPLKKESLLKIESPIKKESRNPHIPTLDPLILSSNAPLLHEVTNISPEMALMDAKESHSNSPTTPIEDSLNNLVDSSNEHKLSPKSLDEQSAVGYTKARNISSSSSNGKRHSAINFARNIINLSVYHDSDSEKSNDPLVDIQKKYIDHRKKTSQIAASSGPPVVEEDLKEVVRNVAKKPAKKRNFLRRKSEGAQMAEHMTEQLLKEKKSKNRKRAKEYLNPNLPTNFSEFVDKFVLPNCEVFDSFSVLEPNQAAALDTTSNNNNNAADESSEQLITNGINKSPKPNSNSIKRSTSFLKKNGFSRKFGKKSKKTEDEAAKAVSHLIDVNDEKFKKKIYQIGTEDFIKMTKYWNYDYTLPEVDKMFPYLHNLELNDNQFQFFKTDLSSKITVPDADLHKQDLKTKSAAQSPKLGSSPVDNNILDGESKIVPLPDSDKYFLLINTNDFYEYDDSKDIKQDSKESQEVLSDEDLLASFMSYVKRKYYLKGSVSPWELLDYDEVKNRPESKKKDVKVRFQGAEDDASATVVEEETTSVADIEDQEDYMGYKYVRLSDSELLINNRKFTGSCKPLNSLKRLNRIKNSDNGENKATLAHNLYNKKINLRNYNFQTLLLFKIAHVVIYNNDNNLDEAKKFARIIGLIQKKIYLNENVRFNNNFKEAHCFILDYDVDKICDFDIVYYIENENVILGVEKANAINQNLDPKYEMKHKKRLASSKYETVGVDWLTKARSKYNDFSTKADFARYLSINPFLAPYSSSILKNNLTNWNKNYLLHEKFENWLITSGAEIYKNVYIGNIIDYNNVITRNKLKEKKIKYLKQLETHKDPSMTYKLRGAILSLQEKIDANPNGDGYRVLINCKEGVEFPRLDLIESVYQKCDSLLANDTDLIYLEFPSAGSFVLSSITNSHMLSIVNFIRLIKFLSSKYKVLVYCYDGFTHLSFLSLLLEISYTFNNLNNAILKYYLVYDRYLYWFKIDYEILNFLQSFILFYSASNPDRRYKPGVIKSIEYGDVKQWFENRYLALYNLSPYELIKAYEKHPEWKSQKDFAVPIVQERDQEAMSKKCDWFDLKNDNNLPSRILPYLYLGGINHLNSITVMELLHINYIITIGEKPTWLNLVDHDNSFDYDSLDSTLKSKLKPTDIVEINNPLPFLKKLIYLPNVQDNGIDTFEPYFTYLLKVIRKLREENQKLLDSKATKIPDTNKVLVNCKVGVSRSASLCIAEVMNFLKISLPRAYLYVRVRRLNLIIQPNLKIFYNLLQLEETLTIKENVKIRYLNSKIEDYNKTHQHQYQQYKDGKKELSLRKMRVLREVDWHVLCKEIDTLNAHYIKG